jgi:hypothetical protein
MFIERAQLPFLRVASEIEWGGAVMNEENLPEHWEILSFEEGRINLTQRRKDARAQE